MAVLTINGLSTVKPDPEHDLVTVEASFDDQPVALQIHRGVLGNLIVSLLQIAGSFPSETGARELLAQPLHLTGAGLVALEDGKIGLELALDQGLRVVLTMPHEGAALLMACVEALDILTDTSSAARSGASLH
ncbi:MAG TPA: hypothetical protein VFG64_00045 [Dongiaceae bacterium]|nr:hypothetical protein [Dongiaceae bacterium]